MRFCISAILVSLISRGGCADAADDAALAGVGGFLPPVSHMTATIRDASPPRSQDCTFLGRRPWGFVAFSCTCTGWVGWLIAGSLLRRNVPPHREPLCADGESPRVDAFASGVNAVF